MPSNPAEDKLFICNWTTGVGYADKSREKHGDYLHLAHLSYSTLELTLYQPIPADLLPRIIEHAEKLKALRGTQYPWTSTQTTTLGHALPPIAPKPYDPPPKRSPMTQAAPTTDNTIANQFQQIQTGLTQAIQNGHLPHGLAVTNRLDRNGLFVTINIEIDTCTALLLDPRSIGTNNSSLYRALNRSARLIEQTVREIAKAAITNNIDTIITFNRSMLARQHTRLRTDPNLALKPLWTPTTSYIPQAKIPAPATAPTTAALPRPTAARQNLPRVKSQISPPSEHTTIQATPAASEARPTQIATATTAIQALIIQGEHIDTRKLLSITDNAHGATTADGAYLTKDAYEAMETAFNKVILDHATTWAPIGDKANAASIATTLQTHLDKLPTQSRRDQEMISHDQYSTPAPLAFIAAWAADISKADITLEPSAGTGSLAVHARNTGSTVWTNEISARRRTALAQLGFEPTNENAEHINDIFASRAAPTRILMNPPFTHSAPTGGRESVNIAGDHIIAAWKHLAANGRLVAITSQRVAGWLSKVRDDGGTVRANIILDGSFFAKSGTHITTRLLVLDKTKIATPTIAGHAATLAELINLLAPVRSDHVPDQTEKSDSQFAPYRAAKLCIPNAVPHPAKLVESHAMSMVSPPDISYKHALPDHIITDGILSVPQLETVIYAGQAHNQWIQRYNAPPARKGYYIGDNTGFGKGREIAGIVLDNFLQGRTKAVWLTSDDSKLLLAAKRDLAALGIDPDLVFALSKIKLGDPILAERGIMIAAHGTLRSEKPGKKSRLDQIIEWLGEDTDALIVKDECHKMGNALERKTNRGRQSPSRIALAVIRLQHELPNARIVDASATGASEAANLAHMPRLGLWGPETPFASSLDFVNKIEESGIAGMEVVARDLKNLGLFCARSLSYEDVTYEKLIHPLTDHQIELYNKMADAWHIVLEGIDKSMKDAGSASNAAARSATLSAYWGAHQRFFNQVLISLQMPTVIDAVKADIDAGHSPILQLVNTMQAATERALAAEGAMDDLDQLDLTPREVLIQYLNNSFPVTKYEEYIDEEGNLQTRPVKDSEDRFVQCAEAVAKRTDLLIEIGMLAVPRGPLEYILDAFGADNVAEITGRNRRVVLKPHPTTGVPTRQIETRTEKSRLADIDAYCKDKKRILVFSLAGGTGADYHASNTFLNKRLRTHYVLQPGWNPKECLQSMGRSNRSNQAQAPKYYLVTTDIKGQMRFVCSIARRLGQMGALTRGQRDASGQGLFSERDNLESIYAEQAVTQIIRTLVNHKPVADMHITEFQAKLGIKFIDEQGFLITGKIPPVKQFLNRLLSLHVDDQNKLFEEFTERMDENIQAAIDRGTYNVGVEEYDADRIEQISDPKVVYTHPESGAQTIYVQLRAYTKQTPTTFAEISSGVETRRYRSETYTCQRKVLGWAKAAKSNRVFAIIAANDRITDKGEVIAQYRLIGPHHGLFVDHNEIGSAPAKTYTPIEESEARTLWTIQAVEIWHTKHLDMLSGLLLPIWDRIQGPGLIYRLSTDQGDTYLGRIIAPGYARETLARLGLDATEWSIPEVRDYLDAGRSLTLANGWELCSAKINYQRRYEIKKVSYPQLTSLREMNVSIETIGSKTRFFIPPTNDAILEEILKRHPVSNTTSIAA